MICPKCSKAEILVELNIIGYIFARKKVYTYYCSLCDYNNKKVFKISESEYQAELEKKGGTS